MKILVTGATGFIGAAISLGLLGRGHNVVAFGRTPEKLEQLKTRAMSMPGHFQEALGDLRSLSSLPKGVGMVIHAAGVREVACKNDPSLAMKVNVGGTARLMALARGKKVKHFVLLSSQAVYGSTAPPWREEQPPHPLGVYGLSKCAQEEVVWGLRGDMDVAVLRLSRVYGVGMFMRWDELIGTFVRRVVLGEPLEVFGEGSQKVDLVHLHDVVRCIVMLAESREKCLWNTTFNVGGGGSVSIREIAETVVGIAAMHGFPGAQVILRPDIVPSGLRHLELNIARIGKLLGWKPRVSLHDGVREYFLEIAKGDR